MSDRIDAMVPLEYVNGHLPTMQRLKDQGIPSYTDLVERIAALEAQQADVAQRITDAVDMIRPYLDQVVPYLERFCNTPVGKMLGMLGMGAKK